MTENLLNGFFLTKFCRKIAHGAAEKTNWFWW